MIEWVGICNRCGIVECHAAKLTKKRTWVFCTEPDCYGTVRPVPGDQEVALAAWRLGGTGSLTRASTALIDRNEG